MKPAFSLASMTVCLASSLTLTHVAQVTAPQRLHCFKWLKKLSYRRLSVCLFSLKLDRLDICPPFILCIVWLCRKYKSD